MHDARVQRSAALEAAVREHLEHLTVLSEYVGLEFRDSVRIGDTAQMLEQQRADAMALELVEDSERDFRAMRIGAANVTADADEALASILSQRRSQSDVTFEIELGQMLQILRRQVAPDSHESKIDRLLAEPLEMLVQAFLIVGTNCADQDRVTIEHRDLDAIVRRVDQHFVISHIGNRVYRAHAHWHPREHRVFQKRTSRPPLSRAAQVRLP